MNETSISKLITQDPDILGGKPIIKGTRMSVESVLELLASGMEIDEIIKDYPILKKESILAAITIVTEEKADSFPLEGL